MSIINFTPRPASTVGVAVTSSPSTAELICTDHEIDLLVYNISTVDVAIEFGKSNVAAQYPTTVANGSMLVAPGSIQVFRGMRGTATGIYVSAVVASGTGTVFVTPGNGS